MELFKKKRQFVQSFESQEIEGLRIYFNAENEKQSNLDMETYLGKNESNIIKLDPHKYKYRTEELLESQLKAMGMNPNKTAHMIYSGPEEIKKGIIEIESRKQVNPEPEVELKKQLNKNDIDDKENFVDINSFKSENNAKIKVNSKNSNEKEININLSDDEGNKSTTKGILSKTGRDIHIHINLGSLPHVEKAMLENQDAIKKLHAEYQKNINETKEIVNNLVQKMNEKVKSNSFSENFVSLTSKSKSPEVPSVQLEKPVEKSPEVPSVQLEKPVEKLPEVPSVQLEKPVEKLPEVPSVQLEKQELKNYIQAVSDSKKDYGDNTIYFRGHYRKDDSVIGQEYRNITHVAKKINGYNVERFEYENKGNYGIIKNHGDEIKIQNFVVSKENIDNIISDKNSPEVLRDILQKYKNKDHEKSYEEKNKNKNINDNSNSFEMQMQ